MTDLPASGYISDNNRTEGEAKQFFEDIRDCINQIPGGGLEQTLAISSGSVTPTRGILSIDTEGATASDTLDAINQGNLPEGSLILVRAANSSQTVTVNHNAGVNGAILLKSTFNQDLEVDRFLWLKRSGTTWEEVSQLDTALSAFPENILPSTDNTYNLGSSGAAWAQVWGETIYALTGISDNNGNEETLADLSDGRAKAYATIQLADGGAPIGTNFNISSTDDNGPGNVDANFTNAFATDDFTTAAANRSGNSKGLFCAPFSASYVRITVEGATDNNVSFVSHGTLA